MKLTWTIPALINTASIWLVAYRKSKLNAGEKSFWWFFVFEWSSNIQRWLQEFQKGIYQFDPMQQYHFADEGVRVFSYRDKFFTHLLLKLIKSTFKYIISPFCFHLQGPSGVKSAIKIIEAAFQKGDYQYAIRADIKSYYASLSHKILINQVNQYFDDPRVRHYLESIITIAVDDGGHVFVPTQGIPRRSSLSPFLGALYLSPLDQAFRYKKSIVYVRYMDDIIILTKTKRHYQKARKILFNQLNALQLKLSPAKTWMGKITHGFHFLGVLFEVPRSSHIKSQVSIKIHPRSCARALTKVKALSNDAVHPAKIQRYLVRWATWWSTTVRQLGLVECLLAWTIHTHDKESSCAWIGRGLLFKPFQLLSNIR